MSTSVLQDYATSAKAGFRANVEEFSVREAFTSVWAKSYLWM
jgi:hypothetical protein